MLRLVAVALALALAGCLAPAAEPDPALTETDAGLTIDAERPRETFGDVVTGPAVGPDLTATTASPPRLVEGEWWRIRFDNDFTGENVEVVRIVADVNEEGYVFGMPHEGWLKEAIAYHAPAFGDVTFELAYNTHNVLFEPVRFPLEQGATWETAFATTTYVATVEKADEHTATIAFATPEGAPGPTDPVMRALGLAGEPGQVQMRLVYDARMHEIVRMESGIGVWEVVEHGYDFQGWVTVPKGEHTAIDYGTFGPASQSHTPVARTMVVEGGFNRMTMMHLMGTITDAPGHFRIRDVTPNGTEWRTEMTGEGWNLRFYEASMPDGQWTVEDLVMGAGFTYSMGIAYHQYDIRLPDGARRADHAHPVIR